MKGGYVQLQNACFVSRSFPNTILLFYPASPIVVLLTEEIVIGVKGHAISLSFSVIGDEPSILPSAVRWYLDDTVEVTEDDERISFSSDRFSLTITNLSLSDEGIYTVNATNIIGTGSAEVFLDVESMT